MSNHENVASLQQLTDNLFNASTEVRNQLPDHLQEYIIQFRKYLLNAQVSLANLQNKMPVTVGDVTIEKNISAAKCLCFLKGTSEEVVVCPVHG